MEHQSRRRAFNMHKVVSAVYLIHLLLLTSTNSATAWSSAYQTTQRSHASSRINTRLNEGTGTATSYRWKEEQFELEITFTVPPDTTAKDIKFKCTSTGIDLRLKNGDTETILLDGSRKTRGPICVDGTFWSIADAINQSGEKQREINVIIEKHFSPTSSSGGMMTYEQLTDFDWKGVYPDDEAEVTSREYKEAEELNVKEYAAKLGVDIDNIDMSKVDKTMFGAGLREPDSEVDGVGEEKKPGTNLNITQATLDQLVKYGLAKEVVRQGDGTEYEMDAFSSDLERKQFSMLGKDILVDELRDAGIVGTPIDEQSDPVQEKKVEFVPDRQDGVDSTADQVSDSFDEEDSDIDPNAKDPIDKLTVVKLKEILRNAGLKVSGNKSELKQRLRDHIQVLLEENDSS